MSFEKRRKICIGLLAVSVIFWFLRKLSIVYIPAASAFALAASMILLGVSMLQTSSSKKLASVFIIAFGLFMIVFGVIELYGYFHG
ncbi:MAG: hypothetical protein Q3985_02240 [Eubacteriales bacterium]|nr:hypothetical protein [Eubacteriales bacterium]